MAKRLFQILLPVLLIGGIVVGGLFWLKANVKTTVHTHSIDSTTSLEDFGIVSFVDNPKLIETKISSIKAKVLVLNFWATWCEACIVEMPSLVQLRQKYHADGLELLAISVDEKPEAVLPQAIKSFKFDFPIYSDANGTLADLFNVSAIPHTVVMNSERKILWVEPGERNWMDEGVQKKIQGFLKL